VGKKDDNPKNTVATAQEKIEKKKWNIAQVTVVKRKGERSSHQKRRK